jgi:hypothetical protein
LTLKWSGLFCDDANTGKAWTGLTGLKAGLTGLKTTAFDL